MTAHFLHIAFDWRFTAKEDEVQVVIAKAIDWLRYAPNCWIIWTRRDSNYWFLRLKPLLGPRDALLIVKLNPEDKQGWLPEGVWNWLNQARKP